MLDGLEKKGETKKGALKSESGKLQIKVHRSPPRSLPNELPSPASLRGTHNPSVRFHSVSPDRGPSPGIKSEDSTFETIGSSSKAELAVEDLVTYGDLEQLKFVLSQMNDENIVSYIETKKMGHIGESLLHLAVKNNQTEIIQYFRTLGVKLALYTNKLRQTPLHYAVKYSVNKETIAELFKFENALKVFDEKDTLGESARYCSKLDGKEKIFSDIAASERSKSIYGFFYEEDAPLFHSVAEAKRNYKAKQKEDIANLCGYVSPYVLGEDDNRKERKNKR
jgi:hypothetical protein